MNLYILYILSSILSILYILNSIIWLTAILKIQWRISSKPKKDPNFKATKKNPDNNKYYSLDGVDYIEIGIREAMKYVSVGLGQGFVRCNCSGKCATKKCGCYEAKIGCNTKFHPKTKSNCVNFKDSLAVEEIEEEIEEEQEQDEE